MGLVITGAATHGLAATPKVIVKAEYAEPTRRYAHGILGDDVEWGALVLTFDLCAECEPDENRIQIIRLPQTRVFEDVAPRLVDLDGSGAPSVVVVESDAQLGARLPIYTEDGLQAATPFIGQRNRWLAPIGAADLDGDGAMEIAYIDRPHLAKTLRVWRWKDRQLSEVGTNHRIGERDIAGGVRTCGGQPKMIVATANWSQVVGVQFDGTAFQTRIVMPHQDRESFAAAMAC